MTLTLTLAAFVFLLGSCIGSFLNVCIYRIPREESIIAPRSHCPGCGALIAWFDNIPLLSILLLRARCRHCRRAISLRYPAVELLTGVLFLLVWLKFPVASVARPLALAPLSSLAMVPVYWVALSGLILGTFVDLEHMIIPDRVSLGGILTGVLFSMLVPGLHGQGDWYGGLISALLGAVVGFGLLWSIAVLGRLVFRKDAMGMGDVKLMGAIGAYLGWPAVVFTLMASSFLGAGVGIALVAKGQKGMQSRIPYGPYIALAALIWILWGPSLWHAYLNWLLPPPIH